MVSTGNTGPTTQLWGAFAPHCTHTPQTRAFPCMGLWRTHPKLTTCALCRPGYNWWSEALHGVARESIATSFPQICGLATSFNTSLFHAVGSAIGLEVSTISRKVDGASRKAERRCGAEAGFARRLLLPCCVVAWVSHVVLTVFFCASRRED